VTDKYAPRSAEKRLKNSIFFPSADSSTPPGAPIDRLGGHPQQAVRQLSIFTAKHSRPPLRRGYTLVEILCSVLIISIMSSLVMVNVGSTDSTTRVDRAAQLIIEAFRYARMLSMGHGQTTGASYQPTDAYGVQIDTTANTVTVYHTTWNAGTSQWNLPGTPVSNGLFGGGTYVINLNNYSACAGVVISAVQLTGTADTSANTSSPYYCQYRPFGNTENPGTNTAALTLSYGGASRTISIPSVGDAQEN
jgi:prepilin-type N-terminal cleavage/methylation domain-containing protein